MNRHLSRTIAMQTLYEWDIRKVPAIDNIMTRNIGEFQKDADSEYITTVIEGVIKNCAAIDGKIGQAAPEWPIEQISSIDKSILRVAVYELLHSTEVPPKVAINEAVELAKLFGSENSSKFINGVLGTIYRASERYKLEEEKDLIASKILTEDKNES